MSKFDERKGATVRIRLDDIEGDTLDHLEAELKSQGITFDTGTSFRNSEPSWRDWELDWSFKAPEGVTRQSVVARLKSRFPEAKIKVVAYRGK